MNPGHPPPPPPAFNVALQRPIRVVPGGSAYPSRAGRLGQALVQRLGIRAAASDSEYLCKGIH